MHIRHRIPLLILLLTLGLTACARSQDASTDDNPPEVEGARNAVTHTLSLLETPRPAFRPPALLGIYVNLFLSDGLPVPVSAAIDGIEAQLKLHARPSDENIENLYALLEEFQSVLHVDVADLLNRSDNRIRTLDLYVTGLQNITERSRRRSADIKEQLTALKTEERDRRATASGLDKEVKNAVKEKDFATAQTKQRELAEAQSLLAATQIQSKEMTTIQKEFTSLIDVASKRLAALESNREVLIAGLTVVDLPGVEDLGVLEQQRNAKKKFSPFGGL